MRTVKRKALPLNVRKQKSLEGLCKAYTNEKQFWLHYFRSWKSQSQLGKPRTIRDELIKQSYQSSNGLQARHWKLALEDATETWDKYWRAIFVKVRPKVVQRKDLSDTERHYAFWLLAGYSQFSAMMQGQAPVPPFSMGSTRKAIAGYVRRLVRTFKGKTPTAKRAGSIRFDANCYDCFEHKGRQYIKLMSLTPGKRILIPLLGNTLISGTITLIFSKKNIGIHIPQELKKKKSLKTPFVAVDFGYTEVMTDTQGVRYGTQFGKALAKGTEDRHQKMKKRHKLTAIEKKKKALNRQKANHLRKYNLGKEKLYATTKRVRATLEKEINTAINQLIGTQHPSVLITEDLRHAFSYNKSKQMNRKLSGWVKGKIQDRITFKALAEGFRHEQVNPAYGSQSCPYCEFVDQKNRKNDRFQCLHCGHEDVSDRIAALNYARRFGDHEIGRYTPYRQVKNILLDRFHRRLETGQPVTVQGRTLETAMEMYPPFPSSSSGIARREKSRKLGGQSESETKNKHV